MKKFLSGKIKQLIIGILLIVAIIQLIPVDRFNPVIESEIVVSPEARNILRKACYDCHSNETKWPWYSKVAPISWLLADDVKEGRKEMNFSTWGNYKVKRQTKLLKKILEEINENEMPPWTYILMHKKAALSLDEREIFRKWIQESTAK